MQYEEDAPMGADNNGFTDHSLEMWRNGMGMGAGPGAGACALLISPLVFSLPDHLPPLDHPPPPNLSALTRAPPPPHLSPLTSHLSLLTS